MLNYNEIFKIVELGSNIFDLKRFFAVSLLIHDCLLQYTCS